MAALKIQLPQDITHASPNGQTLQPPLTPTESSPRPESVHACLTPRSSSPLSASRRRWPDEEILEYFDDDSHSEYEWIRVPKERDYDVVQVSKTKPADRDQANVPLTLTRPDGTRVIMWAKMDTGADSNLINLSTLQAFLGKEKAAAALLPLDPPGETFNLIGSNHFAPKHRVDLTFTAGKAGTQFRNVSFVVYENLGLAAAESSYDAVPDVIVGIATLKANHMVMVDYEFNVEEPLEPGLEVIAQKAEAEWPSMKTLGPFIKAPKRPGVKR